MHRLSEQHRAHSIHHSFPLTRKGVKLNRYDKSSPYSLVCTKVNSCATAAQGTTPWGQDMSKKQRQG